MRTGARGLTATCALLLAGGVIGDVTVVSADERRACSMKSLQVPEGAKNSWVQEGSPDGSMLVGYATVHGERTALLWKDGKPERLRVDLRSVSVAAVNDSGVVAGFGFESDNTRTSFLYRDGAVTKLADPGGDIDATITDLNAAGDAVGYGVGANVALRWSADTPHRVTELPAPGGSATANAIDDDGTAVGYVGTIDDGTQPYLWNPDGSHESLTSIEGRPFSGATKIRGDYIIGFADVDADNGSSLRWNRTDDTLIELPDKVYVGEDVNASGVVAGSTKDDHATLVRGTDLVTLPDADGRASTAYTVSDNGTAAGQRLDENEYSTAVRWTGC